MTKTTIFKTIAVAATGLLLFSCIKPKVTELEVSPKTMNFEAQGAAEQTVTVTANDEWTVTGAPDWLVVTPTSGSGNGSFTVKPNDYSGFVLRDADITVTCLELSSVVKVTQLAVTPSIAVDTKEATLDYNGGGVNLKITSNAPWVITSDADWVTAKPSTGNGNADVVLTVAPNIEREGRVATITVTEKVNAAECVVSITQGEAPASRYSDSLALVTLYNAAKGANWKEGRVWDLSKPMSEWYNVKLDAAGRVTSLNLANGTVTEEWTIPDAIAELSEITNLRIIGCKATGTLPEGIYDLTKLESLYLTNNLITWSISPKIAQLTALKDLYIDQNANLTGTLPAELGQLKALVNINISKTGVSGAVPAELSGCDALKNFMSFEAKLTSLPENLDKWPALEIIMVYGNTGLEGPLPESISKCAKIKTIRFDSCNFTGNIPESYANIPAKQGSTTTQLWLKGNKLQGVVPAAVQAHENWKATTGWKYQTNILPQQTNYGLTLK